MMDSKTIRRRFLSFFEERGHRVVRGAPVVPWDDPTLLFTNAGMNQFKPVFLGEQAVRDRRVVNSQKCIRVSGKHNDLEEVGLDTYHHTFFEMLGNWSFGDYYKAEAIEWAWELITSAWGLDKKRLWATVYNADEEAFALWTKVTDIAPERVLKFGARDNFWEMGATGPCGPCSELHYYVGEDPRHQSAAGVNHSPEYWELWNLVFIQYNRDAEQNLHELPEKHVDTGAGLERLVAVLQQKSNNYETDLFLPLIEEIARLTGSDPLESPIPHRVISDHIRMLCFAIADGAMPANEGRGYVLRRILRRAARFGRMLDMHEPFIFRLVDTLVREMGPVYPELVEKKAHLENVIRAEESSFNDTLDRGLNNFEKVLSGLSGTVIPGREAFRLYDTFGFPLDLTQLLARERGLTVDEPGFRAAMQKQRARAQAAGKFRAGEKDIRWNVVSRGTDSEFLGYKTDHSRSRIRRWTRRDGQFLLVLDRTPFYGESGGQVGDTGRISGKALELRVTDTRRDGEMLVHYCQGEAPESAFHQPVICRVDQERRQALRQNHTATHLLHAALKQVLGEHVHQAGSMVAPDHLRFDLTHFEKLATQQLREIEILVNQRILQNRALKVSWMDYEEARRAGAEALFGEKYADRVRVVSIPGFSMELCGGTHVQRTGDIGLFKITEESALAAGIRRIVAVTGREALTVVQQHQDILEDLARQLQCGIADLPGRLGQQLQKRRELERELKHQPQAAAGPALAYLLEGMVSVGTHRLVMRSLPAGGLPELKQLGDRLRVALSSGVGVLGCQAGSKPAVVVVVTDDLVKEGLQAGELARLIGAELGGGGGGNPRLATAGGSDGVQFEAALPALTRLVREQLNSVGK